MSMFVGAFSPEGNEVFRLFDRYHMPPSEIDAAKGYEAGTARAAIVARWEALKQASEKSKAARGFVWAN